MLDEKLINLEAVGSEAKPLDSWYLDNLACPRDQLHLRICNNKLVCAESHTYPIVDGVPVMLLDDVRQTNWIAGASLDRARKEIGSETLLSHLYLDAIGVSKEERLGIIKLALQSSSKIDPAVAYLVAATNGLMYRHLVGKLDSYPIPDLRLPEVAGQSLLDIGCSWGRWCIAAAQKGYSVVGIDPSLGAIMAARRVSRSLGLSIRYVVSDARHLPFPNASFDNVFSYSVLQHFSREDCGAALGEISRVLKPRGLSFIQMPTTLGFRCLYHQAKRRFREAQNFEVRYWSFSALKKAFADTIGEPEFSVDCYFGIGLQKSDYRLMTPKLKAVLLASETLRRLSTLFPAMRYIADSVYVKAMKS
jgi:2-polyprenyl-3-methyl-5-hydroxy-6-metoxy-1,4-benzoquinol methylase/uncharacterized protein YbaR (Trm112 family)